MKKNIGILVLVFTLVVLAFFIFIGQERELANQNSSVLDFDEEKPVGMFAWDEGSVKNPEDAKLFVEQLSITRWYQELDLNGDHGGIEEFIRTLSEMSVKTYALVGSVEWGYEKDGESLIKEIKKVKKYNENAGKTEKIAGIMVDVEPYISSRWDEHKEQNMENYVAGMIKAYDYGKKNNLVMIPCIPRHYDDQGLSDQLERLISEGCDEVAVMNYDCGNEIEKIATEARLAKKYSKEIHCILEFQEVGKHSLTEDKTYRNKGIAQAQAAWDKVAKAYPGQEVVRDYHWTEPLEEMLKGVEDGR